ncbi:hypothetical protein ACFL2Z_01310 [Candidatus Eisenbacteria bacterium]|uniref:Cytochrome oxidase subunit I profile domain-containing protein n=1 Tax=Eiseniibacteriota bacterium TaxID=2212470 RepID=A0ABV6YNM5_UNCEI
MDAKKGQFHYLFRSTKGLVLLAIGAIALVAAIWGTLSGPMVEWGVRDITVKALGMKLHAAEREGRIVLLYHAIAMAVVAIQVYFITSIVRMKKYYQSMINATVTVGYLVSMIFGLWFGYFGHHFVFHGIYLFGLSLMFFSGLLLAVALWPWNKEYYVRDSAYAHSRGGLDMERLAFFVMAVAALGSAAFGAVTGSYWGQGHETFLAEDLIRTPHKTGLQLAVIGHLHIMLTLIGVSITLVIGRWLDFKGAFHKIAMPMMVFGTVVITLGVWSVVPFEPIAHMIIYVGSVFVMLAALMLVIYGWRKIIRDRLAEQGIEKAGFFTRLKALLHDPLKFGPLWQMVFMNFTVSGVGIFMAIRLDEIFRVWPAREERIILTGHWHILSAIIATIILMYYADIAGLKGKARRWFGWILIIGSDAAFAAVTIFSMKRLMVPEYYQQRLVDRSMVVVDFGLGSILVILAILLLWRLFDLFKADGAWKRDLADPQLDVARTAPPVSSGEGGGTCE